MVGGGEEESGYWDLVWATWPSLRTYSALPSTSASRSEEPSPSV